MKKLFLLLILVSFSIFVQAGKIGKINKVTITEPATSATLTIADGKTATVSNTLTFAGTDGSTLTIGTGGTLGTAAYTAASAYESSGATTTHAALQTGVHGISITAGKTLSSTNTLTFAGTDGSTLNIGTGGTLGTAAYTASTAYQATDASLTSIAGLSYISASFIKLTAEDTYAVRTLAETKTDLGINNVTNESKATMFTSPTFTGTVIIPTPFTLGATSITPTGTELNYVDGVTSAIQAQLDSKATTTSVNAQTGTTYTLLLTDANDIVTMNNAAANTLTIPANSSVAFSVGTIIAIDQIGAGATTITGATGVTVNGVSAGSETITDQYLGACAKKIATDTWIVQGGI